MDTVTLTPADLAAALRRAAEAHHEYEKSLPKPDANWPEWYAAYIAREQTGGANGNN